MHYELKQSDHKRYEVADKLQELMAHAWEGACSISAPMQQAYYIEVSVP